MFDKQDMLMKNSQKSALSFIHVVKFKVYVESQRGDF